MGRPKHENVLLGEGINYRTTAWWRNWIIPSRS